MVGYKILFVEATTNLYVHFFKVNVHITHIIYMHKYNQHFDGFPRISATAILGFEQLSFIT